MYDTICRPLTLLENKILDKLFELNFKGREVFLKQRSGLKAKQIDANGSLIFFVDAKVETSSVNGFIAEAKCPDTNTSENYPAAINILLHAKKGRLWYLEIYKDDSSLLLGRPNPDKFSLFTPKPEEGQL